MDAKPRRPPAMVRTSVLISPDTDRQLRRMAKRRKKGSLSDEIRDAIEAHIERGSR